MCRAFTYVIKGRAWLRNWEIWYTVTMPLFSESECSSRDIESGEGDGEKGDGREVHGRVWSGPAAVEQVAWL